MCIMDNQNRDRWRTPICISAVLTCVMGLGTMILLLGFRGLWFTLAAIVVYLLAHGLGRHF